MILSMLTIVLTLRKGSEFKKKKSRSVDAAKAINKIVSDECQRATSTTVQHVASAIANYRIQGTWIHVLITGIRPYARYHRHPRIRSYTSAYLIRTLSHSIAHRARGPPAWRLSRRFPINRGNRHKRCEMTTCIPYGSVLSVLN